MHKKISFLFCLFAAQVSFAQTKTNLDIFYQLIDTSITKIVNEIPSDQKEIKLNLNLGTTYSVFSGRIISSFNSKGIKIKNASSLNFKINYTIDNTNTNYGDLFRSSFLGSYYLQRNIIISGNYVVSANSVKSNNFNYSFSDSVKFENIEELENISYPFTRGNIPSEPFFSSLIEPIVAIGTAAVAIFLFFNVRSK